MIDRLVDGRNGGEKTNRQTEDDAENEILFVCVMKTKMDLENDPESWNTRLEVMKSDQKKRMKRKTRDQSFCGVWKEEEKARVLILLMEELKVFSSTIP